MVGPGCDSWLVHDGVVLASAEVATTRRERRRGLAGRDEMEGVLVLPVRWIHTFGMRFTIDVLYLDADGLIVRLCTVAPSRLAAPCWAARSVVEAPSGSIDRWQVALGDRLELR